ncbi:MAG: hypothetical protein H7323_14560, partial [Frankiales bacterium]|nr:hypothetical protein [Frankiales bacterium]
MTTTAPDATLCPGCRTLLTGPISCPACGLSLQGPPALRLWEVDTELAQLELIRGELLGERTGLLAALRARDRVAPTATATPLPETAPQRVQNTLLSLGGLLLAVAALVFAAVTYDRLGAGGRAAVLLTLTVAAGLAVPRALRRGLAATAETVTAVTLVLAALDAYGLYRLGLAAGTDPLPYTAACAAVLSAGAAAYARIVPVRLAAGAAVVLAQLPVPLLLLQQEASAATAGLWFAALSAADLAVLSQAVRRPVRTMLVASAGIAVAIGVLLAVIAAEPGRGALALLAHAAVLTAASLLARRRVAQVLLGAAPVVLLATAAHRLTASTLTDLQQPLVLAAVAVLAGQCAALLPAARRTGPVVGALVVAGAAPAAVGDTALSGLLLPLTWLADPWTLPAGATAREAVGTSGGWDGSVVTTVVLAAAAVTTGMAGLALDRLRQALVPAVALLAATAVLLPLGLAMSFPVALTVLVAMTAALLAGAAALPHPLGTALTAGGAAVGLLACAWSVADRGASLIVVAAVALLLAAAAARRTPLAVGATGLAAALAVGELAAVGAARGLVAEQVAGLLLLAVAAVLGGAAALPSVHCRALEAVAVGAGALAACLAVRDAGWLSWVLAGLALLALATALRPDRRAVAVAGGLLLSASSWVRLADAGVSSPEPYVLPLAVAALTLGHLRRRATPGTRSWQAYAPGLSVLLLPSLLASLDDATATRALLIGGLALAVLLVGARARLQAPLAIGGVVLAIDAVHLVGPYAAALPRWSTLGVAGILLVA